MAIDVEAVVTDLMRMEVPDRNADKTIAVAIGMVEKVVNGTTYWALGDRLFHRVPAFTSSIDAALLAVEASGPIESGGVTIGLAPATAVLNDGKHCHGANPALALCVVALTRIAGDQ